MCSHKDSVPSLVPEYKVETLYSGTGTVPEFWRRYQEKRCVHIGARCRIEPGHGARAPSVNTAKRLRLIDLLSNHIILLCLYQLD